MKKQKKTCFIIGGFSVVIGMILVTIGLAFGGFPASGAKYTEIQERLEGFFNHSSDKAALESQAESVIIESGIEEAPIIVNSYNGESISWTGSNYDLPDVVPESLEICLDHSSVEIVKGDVFSVETDVDSSIHSFLDDGDLTIEEDGSWFEFSTRKGLKNNASKVKITLPSSTLDSVNISTGAGNIDISDLITEDLTIDAGAGKVEGKNLIVESSRFSLGAGNVYITEFIGKEDTYISSGIGTVKIEGSLLGSTHIEGGVGSMDLRIRGNMDDYGITAEAGMGNIRVNGQKVSSFFGANYEESGANEILIEGGIGNVDISFAE